MRLRDLTEAKVVEYLGFKVFDRISRLDFKRLLQRADMQQHGIRAVYNDGLSAACSYDAHHRHVEDATMNQGSWLSIGNSKKKLQAMDHGNTLIFKLRDHRGWFLEIHNPHVRDHHEAMRMIEGLVKIVGPMKLVKLNTRMTFLEPFFELKGGQIFESKVIPVDNGITRPKEIRYKFSPAEIPQMLFKADRDGLRGLYDPSDGEVYMAGAYELYHYQIAGTLGIKEGDYYEFVVAKNFVMIDDMEWGHLAETGSGRLYLMEKHKGWFVMFRYAYLDATMEPVINKLQRIFGPLHQVGIKQYFNK